MMCGDKIDRSVEGIIKAWFDYNPKTGEIWWKEWVSPDWYKHKSYHKKFLETRAGKHVNFCKKHWGHLITRVVVGGKSDIFAHHIAWVLTYGKMPEHMIDHIDGDPENNKIENLRDIPNKVNLRNARMYKNNRSGFTGISWCKTSNRWKAYIGSAKNRIYLGSFINMADAIEVREDFIKKNKHLGYTERHGKVSECEI